MCATLLIGQRANAFQRVLVRHPHKSEFKNKKKSDIIFSNSITAGGNVTVHQSQGLGQEIKNHDNKLIMSLGCPSIMFSQ